jgi:hypothetical protein
MMAAAVESVEIARRPEDVFTYVLEPLHYAEWDDSVVSAHREDPSPRAPGSKTTVLHRIGPLSAVTDEGFSPGISRKRRRSSTAA